MYMEKIEALLMDLPTSVRGFVYHDDDGTAHIILNARLSHEQNITTYLHELRHIRRGDLDNLNFHEYMEGSE